MAGASSPGTRPKALLTWATLHSACAFLSSPYLFLLVKQVSFDGPGVPHEHGVATAASLMPLPWALLCAGLVSKCLRHPQDIHPLRLTPRASTAARLLLLSEAVIIVLVPSLAMILAGTAGIALVGGSALIATLAMMLRELVATSPSAPPSEPAGSGRVSLSVASGS